MTATSALETSVGIAAGVALAAALPKLEHACGLATVSLLAGDVVADSLLPVGGALPVRRPQPDAAGLERLAATSERQMAWRRRIAEVGGLTG